MFRKIRTFLFFSVFVICIFFTACSNQKTDVPTPQVDTQATKIADIVHTQSAATLSAAMTKSAHDTTATALAHTATPTKAATRTTTSTITNTPFIGTDVPATLTTGTQQLTAVVFPTQIPTIPKWSCNLIKTTPSYKAEIKAGKAFEAHWQILNSGYQTWYNGEVTAIYRNGYAMHTNKGEIAILDAVDTGEIYEVVVPMKAPLEKGAYSTVWILFNEDDAFCWFTIDIEVK